MPYAYDFRKPTTRFSVGIEIEKEDASLYGKPAPVKWVKHSDGSLNMAIGFELNSPIYDLDKPDEIRADLETIADFVAAKQSTRCGGHIHVAEKDKPIANVMRYFEGYMPLLYAMYPSRVTNYYCMGRKFEELMREYSHYNAIAYNSEFGTVEVRLFPSPKTIDQIMFRFSLLRYILHHPQSDIAAVVKELTTDSELTELLSTVYTPRPFKLRLERIVKYAKHFEDSPMSPTDVAGYSIKIGNIKTRP